MVNREVRIQQVDVGVGGAWARCFICHGDIFQFVKAISYCDAMEVCGGGRGISKFRTERLNSNGGRRNGHSLV